MGGVNVSAEGDTFTGRMAATAALHHPTLDEVHLLGRVELVVFLGDGRPSRTSGFREENHWQNEKVQGVF